MRLRTHVAGGLMVAAALSPVLPAEALPIFAWGAVVGAASPDADFPRGNAVVSAVRMGKHMRFLPIVYQVLVLVARVWGGLLKFLCYLFSFKHRGHLHSFWWSIAFAAAGAIVLIAGQPIVGWWFVGLGAGWLSHLLLDSLTISGIQWWRWRLSGPVRTSSWGDDLVFVACVVAAVLLFVIPRLPAGK